MRTYFSLRTKDKRQAIVSSWVRIFYNKSINLHSLIGIFAYSLILLSFFSCNNQEPAHSNLFNSILVNDSTLFRAARLGQHIDSVQRLEPGQPRHEDLLGLAYEYALPEGGELLVEYYTDNLQVSRQSNTVISVVNNILIEQEAQTTELYEELQHYFQQRYGPSHGKYGDDFWTGELPSGRMEVRLKLNPPEQGITLNFLDLNINN